MSGVASMSKAAPSDGKQTARQATHRRRAGSCRAASQWEQVHAACGRPPSCTVPSTRTKAPGDPEAASFSPPFRPFWRPSPEQLPAKHTAATRRAREKRVKKAPKKEPDSIATFSVIILYMRPFHPTTHSDYTAADQPVPRAPPSKSKSIPLSPITRRGFLRHIRPHSHCIFTNPHVTRCVWSSERWPVQPG